MTTEAIEVLDHGLVRLVDHMGNDLSIVRAARVSYDAAWRAGENEKSDNRLINYLWRNKHTTPFEAVTFTFEVRAPIFVFRQWHRHRTQSYNELSARYRELDEVFYVPKAEDIGVQSKDNKQMRDTNVETPWSRHEEVDWYTDHCQKAFKLYRELLASGWPRELARAVLPFATYSHMFATLNLRNLFHWLELRLHKHAQPEIRVYAEAIIKLIDPIVPVATQAFMEQLVSAEGYQ
jgi:thymidylate synthase (FAD)